MDNNLTMGCGKMLCVLTVCISPGNVKQLELRDNQERLKQYLKALHFYIKSKGVHKIVFCDNSNFEYSYVREKKLAIKYGKQLEILKYSEDVILVEKKGKGYGEGRILEYVFEHSKLLQKENYFYKITGRLIVKNIDTVLKKENCKYNYFNKNMLCFQTIDTRFFGIDKETFRKYFLNAYKRVDDSRGRFLEHCYAYVLQNKKIPYRNHVPFPIIEGVSGTIGKKYAQDSFWQARLNDFLSWTGLYNYKYIYQWLYELHQKKGKMFEDK